MDGLFLSRRLRRFSSAGDLMSHFAENKGTLFSESPSSQPRPRHPLLQMRVTPRATLCGENGDVSPGRKPQF